LRIIASSSAKNSLTPRRRLPAGAGQPVRRRGTGLAELPIEGIGAAGGKRRDQLGAIGGQLRLHLLDPLQLDGDLGVGAGGDWHHLAQPGRPRGHARRQHLPGPRRDVERGDRHPDPETTALEHMSESTEEV
jgi:hypothetical protein